MQAAIPFTVELPFTTFYKAGAEPGKRRRIGGIVSTESRDRQHETVLQRGLDFSEFLGNGWFNDNHSKETTGIVGYPEVIKKTVHKGRPAHYVEGYLLEGYPRADEIWKLGQVLQKTKRRLGFSIEGAVTQRSGHDGKVIAQAKVRNVAITNAPVNTDTGLEILAKSMLAIEQLPTTDEWFRRALMAGQAINNPGTAPGQGFPLRVESMERKPKRKRKLSKAEAIEFLRSRYAGMTDAAAHRILNYVSARHAA